MVSSPHAEGVVQTRAQRVATAAFAVLAVVCGVCVTPMRARAWTDASVRSVKATVTVAADGSAHVLMRVTVRVHGGWLEGLELVGLDPLLVLDPSAPPVVTDELGSVYLPTVAQRPDGDDATRVQLAFTRRSAPRRGSYEVALAYSTSLAHRATEPSSDGESVRVHWTLPPWQSGLDGVELTLDVPGASRPAQIEDDPGTSAAQITVANVGNRTQITWRRPHLPRTTVWEVAADVPARSLAAALRRVRPEAPQIARARPAERSWLLALVLALVLTTLGTLVGRARAAAQARAGSSTLAVVPMPRMLRALAIVALIAAAPFAVQVHVALAALPLAALLLLVLVRSGEAQQAGDDALDLETRSVTNSDLRDARRAVLRARWLTADALFDATTLPGACFFVAFISCALRAQAVVMPAGAPLVVLGAALAVIPLFTLTHRSRRRAPADTLQMLRRTAMRLRFAEGAPTAMNLCVSMRGDHLVAASLRLVPAMAPDGLRAIEIVVAERSSAGAVSSELAVCVTTRKSGDAERCLASVIDSVDVLSPLSALETTRLVPLALLDEVLLSLAGAAAATRALLDAEEGGGDGSATTDRAGAPRRSLRAQFLGEASGGG